MGTAALRTLQEASSAETQEEGSTKECNRTLLSEIVYLLPEIRWRGAFQMSCGGAAPVQRLVYEGGRSRVSLFVQLSGALLRSTDDVIEVIGGIVFAVLGEVGTCTLDLRENPLSSFLHFPAHLSRRFTRSLLYIAGSCCLLAHIRLLLVQRKSFEEPSQSEMVPEVASICFPAFEFT
ncbi:hypothetical protein [Denitrobaculum tricleocarpae]|uniref:hypothetical protein n=1 Tax=Denitrobaculum tricleocarpae TaxID=2591009 RepID=UPI0015D2E860|nr:hypothetical protein [Denitrobaculum tricleocarpae]